MRVIRRMRWLFLGVFAGVIAVLFVNCAETVKPRMPAMTAVPDATSTPVTAPQTVDITPVAVPGIPPGTLIANGPPKGFSHLILKSQPRVGADSIDKVSRSLSDMASMLFTAIVADCRSETIGDISSYALASVAAGVGTKVKADDMVLSSESYGKLGVDLGLIGSQVLGGGEKQLQQMRLVARSGTLAVLDAPTIMLVDGKHQAVVFRYAILVDPKTGRLDALVWPMKKAAGGGWEVIGIAEWLPANKLDDCQLHVDTREFILGMPTASAFAVRGVPKGKLSLDLSGEMKTLAAALPWTAPAAKQLEDSLKALLAEAVK